MKTVKPFRLSVLSRPHRWKGGDVLGVAVMALASLEKSPRLFSEQELWETVTGEIGPGAVFDLGVPKAVPEFLVSGHAYTAHQTEKTVCAVRVLVGGLEKSLTVFGDRYWLDGRMTEALPFESMSVGWERAYGGAGVPENPLGIGTQDEVINGVLTCRLPNVEDPRHRIATRGQRVAPAGLGGLAPESPARMSLMGSKYGADWLQNGFPGFADDMDWRYFNAAAADQRWPQLQALPPGAPYEILNMHPTQAALRGCLPDWRARCFCSFNKDGTGLLEAELRLTTAWFFPHLERVALIWHGGIPIEEDDASDMKHLMPALELPSEPRPLEHYQDVLLKRLQPGQNPGYLLRDADLAPRSVLGSWKAGEVPDVMNRPLPRNLQAGRQRDYDVRRAELLAEGLDPDRYIAPPMPAERITALEDLPEFLERMEAKISEAKQQAAEAQDAGARLDEAGRKMEADAGLPAQAPPAHTDPEEQIRQLDELDTLPQSNDGAAADSHAQLKDRLAAQIRESYLHAAHLSPAAPPMPSFRAAKIRRRLEAAPADGRDFARMSMIGADLSGMDLRNANFAGAVLTDANLSGALLDGCDFSRAVLSRANLTQASLRHATLASANMAGATLAGTVLSHAQLTDANCQQVRFSGCNFEHAVFERTDLYEAEFRACDLRGSKWQQVNLFRMSFGDIAFDEATIEQVLWVECTLRRVSFAGARLVRCAFASTDCSEAVSYARAELTTCSFTQGTSLAQAVFSGAMIKQSSLRGVDLARADLSEVRLDACDFSECGLQSARFDRVIGGESLFVRADFTGASLRHANLIDANLSKAVLSFADLSGANLFRTDVSQALIDGSTRLDGAYTHGAKVWPARRSKGRAA
ncbi:DUF2169 domain-containing protein [Variovorax sp. DXTD-1]|uniref:DUF2169 family type VI secretion system accessory protein n=1 Tax=Variovorax sp. DXTD-1 TaxID=2495592 RepID=UPI000F8632B0|nr:DUF2169 domain-containing protein [Variovorax sp. DXTD-1]RST52524.1 pentapeptide repeat-containing protein [Variovorax sp. DXTD-1]